MNDYLLLTTSSRSCSKRRGPFLSSGAARRSSTSVTVSASASPSAILTTVYCILLLLTGDCLAFTAYRSALLALTVPTALTPYCLLLTAHCLLLTTYYSLTRGILHTWRVITHLLLSCTDLTPWDRLSFLKGLSPALGARVCTDSGRGRARSTGHRGDCPWTRGSARRDRGASHCRGELGIVREPA